MPSAVAAVLLSVLFHAGEEFDAADAVLIIVVGVYFLDREVGVGVSLPAAAEIERLIDTPDRVVAADAEGHGVVLAVAHVREEEAARYRGEEGAGGAETVDAQGIVRAIGVGPFLMVDEARSDHIAVEVGERVASDHHCVVPLAESGHDGRECRGRLVNVVGVELHGEASATF